MSARFEKIDVDKWMAERAEATRARLKAQKVTKKEMLDEDPVTCNRCGITRPCSETMGAFCKFPIPDSDGDYEYAKLDLCQACARYLYVACDGPFVEENVVAAARKSHAAYPWTDPPWMRQPPDDGGGA